jgi:hypothetical protein
VLLLLVERAVVLVRGRRAALFLVFIVPLVAMVFLLFYVRLRVYAGG